jgi:hypothetical protein
MMKIEEYHRAAAFCDKKASESRISEIRQIWITIGSSFQYLAEIETSTPQSFSEQADHSAGALREGT